jgi:hypothetical protein
MKENQMITLQEWPGAFGGGITCVHLMLGQILRLLNLPYSFVVTLINLILSEITTLDN